MTTPIRWHSLPEIRDPANLRAPDDARVVVQIATQYRRVTVESVDIDADHLAELLGDALVSLGYLREAVARAFCDWGDEVLGAGDE